MDGRRTHLFSLDTWPLYITARWALSTFFINLGGFTLPKIYQPVTTSDYTDLVRLRTFGKHLILIHRFTNRCLHGLDFSDQFSYSRLIISVIQPFQRLSHLSPNSALIQSCFALTYHCTQRSLWYRPLLHGPWPKYQSPARAVADGIKGSAGVILTGSASSVMATAQQTLRLPANEYLSKRVLDNQWSTINSLLTSRIVFDDVQSEITRSWRNFAISFLRKKTVRLL